jgi:hypothetical protein
VDSLATAIGKVVKAVPVSVSLAEGQTGRKTVVVSIGNKNNSSSSSSSSSSGTAPTQATSPGQPPVVEGLQNMPRTAELVRALQAEQQQKKLLQQQQQQQQQAQAQAGRLGAPPAATAAPQEPAAAAAAAAAARMKAQGSSDGGMSFTTREFNNAGAPAGHRVGWPT